LRRSSAMTSALPAAAAPTLTIVQLIIARREHRAEKERAALLAPSVREWRSSAIDAVMTLIASLKVHGQHGVPFQVSTSYRSTGAKARHWHQGGMKSHLPRAKHEQELDWRVCTAG
jgi:hypothetical protein